MNGQVLLCGAIQEVLVSRPCRILLIEHHTIVRYGVRRMLEQHRDMSIVDEACTAREGIEKIHAHSVDIVLTEIDLPDYSGVTLISQLNKQYPGVKSIVLSRHKEHQFGIRAVLAGASGYLVKSTPLEEICEVIQHVFYGGTYFSDYICAPVSCLSGGDTTGLRSVEQLSKRERGVLYMVGHGLTSAEIARNLSLSIKTIDAHRENIKKKLSLRNSSELIRYAVCWVEGCLTQDAKRYGGM